MAQTPIVYIIAGPNGAGKTTFANEFLPNFEDCREFVNVDLMASGLSPFSPRSVNVTAGKLGLNRIKELAAARKTFGFESTLAGKTYLRFLNILKKRGYEIRIYFLWIQNVELAVKRVQERVKKGGHSVPQEDIRRRYTAGLKNLFFHYRHYADFIAIIDNSTEKPGLIAIGDSKRYRSNRKQVIEKMKAKTGFPVDWQGD